MELLSGLPLLFQQITALLKKNFILTKKNKIVTILQLLSWIIFMSILFSYKKYTQNSAKKSSFAANPDPETVTHLPIPPCEDKFFINRPCYDFVWSGNNVKRIEDIATRIMANNPSRPVPNDKVKSFQTKKEMVQWIMDNPSRTPGALYFELMNDTIIAYGTKTDSVSSRIGRKVEDPTMKFQMPLQLAASREIGRSLVGDPNFSWNVGLKAYGHPGLKSERMNISSILIEQFSGIFYMAAAMFAFTFQVSAMVLEKELKHRQAMMVMGLFDTAYWSSLLIWNTLLTFVSTLIIVLFGVAIRWDVFVKNNFVYVFLLFYLFQFNLMCFGFFISTFLSKSSSTTSVAFAMFLVSVFAMPFTMVLKIYNSKKKPFLRFLWSMFPSNPFNAGLVKLNAAARGDGIGWRQLSSCDYGRARDIFDEPGVCYPISYFYKWFICTIVFWIIMAIYLDNVIPNPAGSRKSFIYFLKLSYWTGGDDGLVGGLVPAENVFGLADVPNGDEIDETVTEEENATKEQTKTGRIDPTVAVQFRGLRKRYEGRKCVCKRCFLCCFCCVSTKMKPFTAVKGLWLNFPKDQLFCLLGPNGAGKTTSISCLIGITPVTSGDVLVYGNSITSTAGMQKIRSMMGVCTQFDTLWSSLTGLEHLILFASIKGLPRASLEQEARRLLDQVKLSGSANLTARRYSGGMKRRLSVAIALTGDPKLVIMDEPTTGMDPVARRHVWSVIESAKIGRSIILTTHSMEEADILSDRIGIMAKGKLRCVGNSTLLKSKFGTGFTAKVSFPKVDGANEHDDVHLKRREAVKDYFKEHLSVDPEEENKYFLTFVIAREKEDQLEDFFSDLETKEEEFGILNAEIGLATLEEVFLNIANKADLEAEEVETANPVHTMQSVYLPSGLVIPAPTGARFVDIPGSKTVQNPRGLMVEVYWQCDPQGRLFVAGVSPEMLVPDEFPLPAFPTNHPGNPLPQHGLPNGIPGNPLPQHGLPNGFPGNPLPQYGLPNGIPGNQFR